MRERVMDLRSSVGRGLFSAERARRAVKIVLAEIARRQMPFDQRYYITTIKL